MVLSNDREISQTHDLRNRHWNDGKSLFFLYASSEYSCPTAGSFDQKKFVIQNNSKNFVFYVKCNAHGICIFRNEIYFLKR